MQFSLGAKTQIKPRRLGVDKEVLSEYSGITEQPEAPEGSKVSERFQSSLPWFAFAHCQLAFIESKIPGAHAKPQRLGDHEIKIMQKSRTAQYPQALA